MTRALIVVDVQRDFVEGGSLAVAGGNDVAERIGNLIMVHASGRFDYYDYMVATKDFHLPADSNGGHISDNPDFVDTWPEHCIQGTTGALFHDAIAAQAEKLDAIFYKGQGFPHYSGFQGVTPVELPGREPGDYLLSWLEDREVTHVDVVGIATDYCVYETAVDAVQFGFKTHVPLLLTAAVGGEDAKVEAIRKIRSAQGLDPDHLT